MLIIHLAGHAAGGPPGSNAKPHKWALWSLSPMSAVPPVASRGRNSTRCSWTLERSMRQQASAGRCSITMARSSSTSRDPKPGSSRSIHASGGRAGTRASSSLSPHPSINATSRPGPWASASLSLRSCSPSLRQAGTKSIGRLPHKARRLLAFRSCCPSGSEFSPNLDVQPSGAGPAGAGLARGRDDRPQKPRGTMPMEVRARAKSRAALVCWRSTAPA